MEAKLSPFKMCKKHENEASQYYLPNVTQTSVFLRFDFLKRIHGIIFIFILCKTSSSTL